MCLDCTQIDDSSLFSVEPTCLVNSCKWGRSFRVHLILVKRAAIFELTNFQQLLKHYLVPLLVYLNTPISTNINNKTNYFTGQHFSNTLNMDEHVFFTCFTSSTAKQAWLKNLVSQKKKKKSYTGSSQCFLCQKLLSWAYTEETRSIDRETQWTAKTQKPALGVGAHNTHPRRQRGAGRVLYEMSPPPASQW